MACFALSGEGAGKEEQGVKRRDNEKSDGYLPGCL